MKALKITIIALLAGFSMGHISFYKRVEVGLYKRRQRGGE